MSIQYQLCLGRALDFFHISYKTYLLIIWNCSWFSVLQTTFPANDPAKLADLRAVLDLMTSISFFRLKVQELPCPPRAPAVVRECVQASMTTTYRDLFDRCADIWAAERGETAGVTLSSPMPASPPAIPISEAGTCTTTAVLEPPGIISSADAVFRQQSAGGDQHSITGVPTASSPGPTLTLKNLDFWHELAKLIDHVIEEDKTKYNNIINQYDELIQF